eukprot:TRINITY_DN18448_c0_g1_i2.p3 TRINITY_DN18448_c0_g1~~TRINITY_DN18448_c0_g1_i2.p3  ORF type:complete len:147 (+),score=11.33 TRINITY_DN18448_c0_g1_i2:90-530(+)
MGAHAAGTGPLDFGSGFRKPLHAFHGKGAWMTVKPGLERMHGESPELPADWLAGLGIEDVERFFLPGLLSSEEGAVRSSLKELLRLFLAACRSWSLRSRTLSMTATCTAASRLSTCTRRPSWSPGSCTTGSGGVRTSSWTSPTPQS